MKSERRKFIKLSGMAAAGAFILPACSSSSTKSAGEASQVAQAGTAVEREIGIQLYTLRNQLSEDLPGTIKKVSDIGYDYVELFGYGNGQYFGMPVADFYKMLADNNLKLRSGHYVTGNTSDNPPQGTLVNGWEKAVEDAAMGGQQYMVCAYLTQEERQSLDDYKKLVDQLNSAASACKDAGIQFCYHNHDFEFQEMEGQLPIDVILSGTDPEMVKMELDLFWIVKAGKDPLAFFEKYPGRIPLWHVKDMEKGGEQSFTEVGNGVIDFKEIFDNAEKAGMESFFVEQDVSDNPVQSITQSHSYLTNQVFG